MADRSSVRPVVKRTYGARKPLSSSPASLNTPAAHTTDEKTTTPRVKRTYGNRARSSDAASTLSSSSSSSPRPATLSDPSSSPDAGDEEGNRKAPPAKAARSKGDLRSFFERRSPPKKRRRIASPPLEAATLGEGLGSGGAGSSRTTLGGARVSAAGKPSAVSAAATKPVKLEQLYLDPFKDSGHATLSCSTCALSYSRTPEDVAFHDKHHKQVVNGCDWIASDEAKGVTVLDSSAEWGKSRGGKVLMVDYPLVENNVRRKLKDVLETIDTELSSTSLTPAQLDKSKIFLFITSQRKVIACAVVQRIDSAYQAVPILQGSVKGDGERAAKADLVRFGEEDQGAIFCSPERLPTLLGVQRIWTSNASRRCGLASRLLDFMAAKYIYGSPIPFDRRQSDVAFSQPTGKGQKLARAWTGSDAIRVFVD
ncbi:hypothetical protein B0A53_00783 [Rhodotorula sp. CCFEE 5036]|nr:hypothetical protein B0A53_00783 [Rhodotorula sp. CCFEE 5036]